MVVCRWLDELDELLQTRMFLPMDSEPVTADFGQEGRPTSHSRGQPVLPAIPVSWRAQGNSYHTPQGFATETEALDYNLGILSRARLAALRTKLGANRGEMIASKTCLWSRANQGMTCHMTTARSAFSCLSSDYLGKRGSTSFSGLSPRRRSTLHRHESSSPLATLGNQQWSH